MSINARDMSSAQIKAGVRPITPHATNPNAWVDTPNADRHANTMTMQSDIETKLKKQDKQDKQEWILEIRRSKIQRLFGNRKLYIK